jgi:hypothetical protein
MALRRVISSHLDLYDRSRRRSPRPAGDLHARSCPARRHRCADQPWTASSSPIWLTAISRSALASPLEPRPPQRLKTLLSQALVLVAIELFLLLAGLGLIQCLSWAVRQVSTTLEGLIVILGV